MRQNENASLDAATNTDGEFVVITNKRYEEILDTVRDASEKLKLLRLENTNFWRQNIELRENINRLISSEKNQKDSIARLETEISTLKKDKAILEQEIEKTRIEKMSSKLNPQSNALATILTLERIGSKKLGEEYKNLYEAHKNLSEEYRNLRAVLPGQGIFPKQRKTTPVSSPSHPFANVTLENLSAPLQR